MRSSYNEDDVILLLKDITGLVAPQPTQEREKLIQAGKHYSEMLPRPTQNRQPGRLAVLPAKSSAAEAGM